MEQLSTQPAIATEEEEDEMIVQEPTNHRRQIIAGCVVALLASLLVALISICGGLWWTVATVTESVTVYPTMQPLYLDQGGSTFPAIRSTATALPMMSGAPTPVIPPTNLEGGQRQPGAQSHSLTQPAITDRPLQPYVPYTAWREWENSTAAKSRYLARVNLTGQRRTPYSKGQRLQYADGRVMTVKTGDFDFTLLVDTSGQEWMCGPAVNTLADLGGCYFWR